MAYISASAARNVIKQSHDKLDWLRRDVARQLAQMDVENNAAKETMTDIVREMTHTIDAINSELGYYAFE